MLHTACEQTGAAFLDILFIKLLEIKAMIKTFAADKWSITLLKYQNERDTNFKIPYIPLNFLLKFEHVLAFH